MFIDLFIRGVVIGLAIAAPVGPIGALCIRTTLKRGRVAGLCCGMGAATADAVYGAIAAAGISALTQLLISGSGVLHILGGCFLCYLGLSELLSARKKLKDGESGAQFTAAATQPGIRSHHLKTFVHTFGLTIANPATIMSFAAIFASVASHGDATVRGTNHFVAIVLGVFLGSSLWWLFLTGAISAFKKMLSPKAIAAIDIMSGILITAFGAFALLSR